MMAAWERVDWFDSTLAFVVGFFIVFAWLVSRSGRAAPWGRAWRAQSRWR